VGGRSRLQSLREEVSSDLVKKKGAESLVRNHFSLGGGKVGPVNSLPKREVARIGGREEAKC